MTQILLVDACVRRTHSRTLELAEALLERRRADGEFAVQRLELAEAGIQPLNAERLAERDRAVAHRDFSGRLFRPARMLTEADEVVIAAPCYDFSFPALLKVWIEAVMVANLTFRYGENGRPESLLRVKRLRYVTTSGGDLTPDFGYGYVKAIFQGFFGVTDARLIAAEGLDIVGNAPDAIMEAARARIAAEKY